MVPTTRKRYEEYFDLTQNAQAAAQLVLAAIIRDLFPLDSVSHEICMGIRKGLFGSNADDDASITEIRADFNEVADSLVLALEESGNRLLRAWKQ